MPRRTALVRNGVLQDAIVLHGGANTPPTPIIVGTPEWSAWLATHAGFRFESPAGTFTARRERRSGGWYWYAARRRHSTLRRAYLGKAEDLTLERLTAAAAELALPASAATPAAEKYGHESSSTQLAPILRTKLAAPRPRAPLVARERLLRLLDAGIDHKLTLVAAPAGFGKTTLVTAWLARRRDEHDFPPIAWMSLDAGDNDPVRFWRYILTACQAFDADVSRSALALLQGAPPPWEALLTSLINGLARLSRRGILVLEDYHVITAAQIHEHVIFFLDRLPPTLHVMLLTRSDPPLPLARLRAHQDVYELRAADLRFSLEETRTFLEQASPIPLPPDLVTHLAARTEGWVTGLRLLTLALHGQEDQAGIERYLATFSGSHRPIVEYLIEDVFSAQPTHLKQFLLQTCILDRMCGPLCDAVLGLEAKDLRIERADPQQASSLKPQTSQAYSQLILDQLARANLFLVPLDDVGQWYRYHTLFAEAIQQYARDQLGEARLREVADRASWWYEAHGMLSDAIEAALTAQTFARAASLVERTIAPQLIQNEYHTLRRWIAHLPEAVLGSHPGLCLIYAMAILFTSDRYAPEMAALLRPPLELAAQRWRADGNWAKLGELLAFRSLVGWFQGDAAQAFADVRQALELLPEENGQWRGMSLIFVGLEEVLDGTLNGARSTLLQARELCQTAGNLPGVLDASLLLGRVCMEQGELRQAVHWYQQVLIAVEQAPMDRELAEHRRGRALLGLSALHLEWNELSKAERHAAQALDVGRSYGDEELQVQSALVMARVQQAREEYEQAQHRLQALVAHIRRPLLRREAETCQARLALAAGNLAVLERWAANQTQADSVPRLQHEQEMLLTARLNLAQGALDAAFDVLTTCQAEAHAGGRTRGELEVMVLLALVHAARNDAPQARHTLLRALSMAQLEGFQRIFLDEGEPLAALLRTILSNKEGMGAVAGYARALLYATAHAQPRNSVEATVNTGAIVEPLSTQEQRVLRLLAAGHSNGEIAQELTVSVNTVKTHLRRIYQKLNVTNRQEARATARQLHLV